MKKKVNWGILGCAKIARVRTIPGLLQADNANLCAIASRGMQKAQALEIGRASCRERVSA